MTKIVQQNGGEIESHIYAGVDHVAILGAFSIPYRSRFEVVNDIVAFVKRASENDWPQCQEIDAL